MMDQNAAGVAEPETRAESSPASSQPPERKKKKRKWLSPKWLVPVAMVVVCLGVGAYFLLFNNAPSAAAGDASDAALTEYTVGLGSITYSISGTGSVQPKETYDIVTTASGDIVADYFDEDDIVEEDSLLYSIDSDEVMQTISDYQEDVQDAQTDYQDALSELSNQYLYAGYSGTITQVYIQNGDTISENSVIADVVNTSQLVLTVPFITSDARAMSVGQSAQVTLSDSGTVLSGTLTQIYSGSEISDLGTLVTKVEITFANPGAVREGTKATAIAAGRYACSEEGTTAYTVETSIRSTAGGEVSGFDLKAGDWISSGQLICTLENDSAQKNVESARDALDAAQQKLENAQDSMQSYEITAPISGTVVEKSVKAGDTLTSSNGSTLATIADMSELVFTISVDETEISLMREGQSAVITADAFEDEVYEGVVTNVSTIGASSNGVTTYPVTISIADYGDLLPGMNVSAEIILDSAENVLVIPVDAVTRGNFVLVKDTSAAVQDENAGFMGAQAPEGYRYVEVELGLSDEDNVQIVSGLTEGDIIGYTQAGTDDTAAANGFGDMPQGAMSGGFSGGAMPDGGGAPGGGF